MLSIQLRAKARGMLRVDTERRFSRLKIGVSRRERMKIPAGSDGSANATTAGPAGRWQTSRGCAIIADDTIFQEESS